MKYTIHSRNNTEYSDAEESRPVYYGVEIQPPLKQVAVDGMIDTLTTIPARHAHAPGGQEVPAAASVRLVRQDEAGTALWIRPTDRFSTPAEFARHIGQLIDPCSVHEIDYADGVQNELGSPGALYEQSTLTR
jgi:hypothetical protein